MERFKFLPFIFLVLCTHSVFGQFQLNGDASQLGANVYQITPNQDYQASSIWNQTMISLLRPFEFYGKIYLGNNDLGADGMTFAFQAVNINVGGPGGGLGILGVNPSLAIEFDTYPNGSFSDPNYDHIALISQGSNDHSASTNLAGPGAILAGNANAEDGAWHDLRVSWNPVNDSLKVYVDCSLQLRYEGDIVNQIFGGNSQVFWGFTGGTGYYFNEQKFEAIYYYNEVEDSMCMGEFVQLSSGAGISYNWSPGQSLNDPTIANPIASPYDTTLYTCTIVDLCGNTRQEYFLVEVSNIGLCAPWSLKIRDLEVEMEADYASLTWKIEGGQPIDNFTIERGTDNLDFEPIGNTKIKAFSSNYQYRDENVGRIMGHTIYYRISSIDGDGNQIYSSVQSLERNTTTFSAQTYPNPFSDQLNVVIRGAEKNAVVKLQLIDLKGKIVYQGLISDDQLMKEKVIELGDLPSGLYLLNISDQKRHEQIRFRVLKAD